MEIIGKTNHKQPQIEQRFKEGFRKFELYSVEEMFNEKEIGKLKSIKDSLRIDFISLHIPHVELDKLKSIIEKVDYAGKMLGVKYTIMHSSFMNDMPPDLLELTKGNKILENTKETNPGKILDLMSKGFNFCLDIAHLFRNSRIEKYDYFSALKEILEKGSDSIKLVHFSDSVFDRDNLSLGEGLMDIEKSFQVLGEYYDGYVVVEVPMDKMKKDKDYLESLIKQSNNPKNYVS
ncbi:MAG: hypothetical protein COY38_03945 [Candidatus Aenigmarchaeota archaeon CG_4_10_14_0_8_um_filter_37_24]|nr:MAG: hypothetical protein AUJ50_03785 [Candidatus Aenigmarchaeota archaeon CG1_02_38_14]PIV69401.1 MAG: hypothetical protein COS07_00925 [Candidatus Aenigmarchaeota archaeon CG01_land_8_20_14_3_00_37_9]PIW41715.1 MAG: hypothetical protein COW21_00470 [Candidatus Aenigmarchaeota archaeon CG15_BIG_FIL_POST_REV_8_21_14_020_37_27]PIX50538.1 MAG: hypothetical protein COZ52_03430 [Candidatus Aenigmarchaeota archaeon CG_4_8_14_3_um_filter_37_24]PIY34913.1 MAG: hypothetical protein COZ04_05275 [Cand